MAPSSVGDSECAPVCMSTGVPPCGEEGPSDPRPVQEGRCERDQASKDGELAFLVWAPEKGWGAHLSPWRPPLGLSHRSPEEVN